MGGRLKSQRFRSILSGSQTGSKFNHSKFNIEKMLRCL